MSVPDYDAGTRDRIDPGLCACVKGYSSLAIIRAPADRPGPGAQFFRVTGDILIQSVSAGLSSHRPARADSTVSFFFLSRRAFPPYHYFRVKVISIIHFAPNTP